MRLMDYEKNKLVNELTGEKNAGFIHDTLIDVLARSHHEEAPKETILKPEEQVIKPIPVPLQEKQSNIRNSNIYTKKYDPPLQKSEIRPNNDGDFPNLG